MPDLIIAVAEGALADLDRISRDIADEALIHSGDVSTPQAVADLTSGADALIVSLQRLDTARIEALSGSVRSIGRAGVGLDTIDLAAADARGIQVVYQPGYATNEVADHAVSMLLAAQRRLLDADRRIRSNGWFGGHELGPVAALHEATAGVIGTGRIGRAVIDRLRPFVTRVLGYDIDTAASPDGAFAPTDLPTLLRESHLVTLHLPLTGDTRHLIGAAEIAALPPGAVLVNVSRGGLIDEHALAEALHDGRLAGAALDVFETEPLPPDSPLRSAPNLLLSPHMAWYSSESGPRLAEWTITDVLAVLRGNGPEYGRIALSPGARP